MFKRFYFFCLAQIKSKQILLIRINFDFIEKVQCNVQYCDVIARISLFHVALPASKINS